MQLGVQDRRVREGAAVFTRVGSHRENHRANMEGSRDLAK